MELAPSAAGLALMALAAAIIGYSKTALGGLAVIAVAIFATVLPAKESTAAILAILIVGDVIACWHYRHDADWSLIKRLLPAVVPGLVIGALFLRAVDDSTLRRTIGGVLLVLVLLQLWVKWRSDSDAPSTVHERRAASWTAGSGVGRSSTLWIVRLGTASQPWRRKYVGYPRRPRTERERRGCLSALRSTRRVMASTVAAASGPTQVPSTWRVVGVRVGRLCRRPADQCGAQPSANVRPCLR